MPDGVVNIVPTTSAGTWFDAAVDHPATRMVSFTGSTEVGRMLLRRCADRVLKTCMELGGNAPFIVFDDADLDAAVEGAMVAKMRHSAETCTAANRFFVEGGGRRRVHRPAGIRHGRGEGGDRASTPVSRAGPMINETAINSIDSLVQDAVSAGAVTATGGSPIAGPGLLLPADRSRQRCRRLPHHARGDLRPGSPRHPLRRLPGDDPTGQRHRDGAGRLRLHPRHRPRPRGRRTTGIMESSGSIVARCRIRRPRSVA